MKYLLSILFLFSIVFAKADEGMWLLTTLDKLNIQTKGSKLSPNQIYSVDTASVKDAVVGLGSKDRPFRFFCSAEIVSSQGLVFTNHHCAYEYIQSHSTVEHDYLRDGFWSNSFAEELPNEGLTASIVVSVIDVTDSILNKIPDTVTYSQRNKMIDSLSLIIEKQVENTTEYHASVQSFFNNNQYLLYTYIIYEDVRLVGTPPESIGKFGGDSDNWEWPRHTGDFAVLRIYTDSLGKPAKYSPQNIPLKPKYYLPVSVKGVQDKDYAMVLGFPGSTERHITSAQMRNIYAIENKVQYALRSKKLAILKEYMDADNGIRIQYASKYARSSNYWKYMLGQNKGIERLQVIDKKIEREFALRKLLNDSVRVLYDSSFAVIDTIEKQHEAYVYTRSYFREVFIFGAEIHFFPYYFQSLAKMLKEKPANSTVLKSEVEKLRKKCDEYYKDYSATVDKQLLIEMLSVFQQNVAAECMPTIYKTIESRYKNSMVRYCNMVFAKSIFATKGTMDRFFDNMSADVLENDPAYILMMSFYRAYRANNNIYTSDIIDAAEAHYNLSRIELHEYSDSLFYPDANFTLRFTYGYVGSYAPCDGVFYDYYTTTKGILEKEDSSNMEFRVPARLHNLIKASEYGSYAKNGIMPVCFITNNDITGGSSGSSVLNSNGELIGIAFDGNWEAMSGDLIYEPHYQRCISVDIRYVLFIIDKFAQSQRLIDELLIRR